MQRGARGALAVVLWPLPQAQYAHRAVWWRGCAAVVGDHGKGGLAIAHRCVPVETEWEIQETQEIQEIQEG